MNGALLNRAYAMQRKAEELERIAAWLREAAEEIEQAARDA